MKELVGKLETVGFEIIEKRYSYGFWGSLAWRLSIRNPLKMINKKQALLSIPAVLSACRAAFYRAIQSLGYEDG